MNRVASRMVWYDLIGHSFFLAFLLFSILYFKERLFVCDAAYYSWHLTNYEEIFIKHKRWINYLTQFPAWLGIKAGVSLQTALILYSATFGVLYYLGFLLVRYVWKNRLGALYLVLAMVLALRYKHFSGSSEIVVAIFEAAVFLCFVLSTPFREKPLAKVSHWITVLILLLIMTMTHPVIVVPILLIMGFEFIHENRWKDKKLWIATGLTILLFALRYLLVQSDAYESNKMSILAKSPDVFFNPGDYYIYHIVWSYFKSEYAFVVLLLGYTLYKLKPKFKLYAITYYVVINLAFLFMIMVIESYLNSDVLYMLDGYLGMFGLIWGVPIIKYLREKPPGWYTGVIIAIIICSSALIFSKKSFFANRLHNYKSVIKENNPARKLYADMKFFDWDMFWYPYEVPMETLMLSCLEGKDQCATLFFNFEYKPEHDYLETKNVFYNFGNQPPHTILNHDYYQLPEEPYKKIESVPWKK